MRRSAYMRRLLALSPVLFAALLLAPPASATVYCVPAQFTGCVGSNAATIQVAFELAKASAADDVVRIAQGENFAPGLYDPLNSGNSNSGKLEVIGSGVNATTIVGNEQQDALRILRDGVRSPTVVRNLRVLAGQNAVGITSYGKVQDVVVNAKFATDRTYGISLYGNDAEATGVTVDLAELSENSNHQGISIGGSDEITTGARVSNATIVADHGIDTVYPVTVSNVTVDTRRNGIIAKCVPLATLHNVDVLAPANGTPMIIGNSVCGNGTFNTLVDAHHVTLVGGGINGAYGAVRFLGTNGINQLNLRSSIVADAHHLALGIEASAKLKVSHSLLESNSVQSVDVVDEGGNVAGVDPLFRNLAAGDLALRWPSRAIDLGPTAFGPGDPPYDRTGFYRLTDGDGDGVARSDAGAHEYYGPAAKVTATPATVNIGEVVTFDASASTSYADPTTFAWTFSEGSAAGNVKTLQRAYGTAGTRTAAVTVTDAHGLSATQTVDVTVVDPNAPTPAPTATATPTVTPTPGSSAADFSFAPGKRLTFRRNRAGAAIVVNGPGRATGVLRTRIGRRDKVIARGTAAAGASGRVGIVLRMSKANARLLRRTIGRRSRKAALRVTFTRTDGAAKTRSRSVSIRLR